MSVEICTNRPKESEKFFENNIVNVKLVNEHVSFN